MPSTPYIPNWQVIRAALEKAYAELGLEKPAQPATSSFQDGHWELAVAIYNQAKADQADGQKCWGHNCKVQLNFSNVIRCLDCKMQLCENCAKAHFGEGHEQRARFGRN